MPASSRRAKLASKTCVRIALFAVAGATSNEGKQWRPTSSVCEADIDCKCKRSCSYGRCGRPTSRFASGTVRLVRMNRRCRLPALPARLVVSLQRRSSSSARVLWSHLTRLRVSFAPPTTLSERSVRRSLLLLEPLHRIVCSVSGASRLPLNPCKRSEHSDGLAATSESPHRIRCMPLHFTESYSARSACGRGWSLRRSRQGLAREREISLSLCNDDLRAAHEFCGLT
jgi:hypothetical protein